MKISKQNNFAFVRLGSSLHCFKKSCIGTFHATTICTSDLGNSMLQGLTTAYPNNRVLLTFDDFNSESYGVIPAETIAAWDKNDIK